MEISSFKNLAELSMDDPLFFHQWPVTSLQWPAESSQTGANTPLKQLTSNIPNLPSDFFVSQSSFGNQNFTLKPCEGPKGLGSSNTRLAQANDHILSERKRREKISQRFIALSALVPGLKKMDKASVLGDAIKHMKQLQERVKILEEQTKKKSMESLVFIKKHKICADSENPSSVESPVITEKLPKIEARFCNKDVLIIIHCEKRKGLLERAVAEIEKLHLSVVNSCVMTFGDSTLNITITAQKDEDFTMEINELMKNLRGALEIFM